MRNTFSRTLGALVLVAAGAAPLAAQRWVVQYFYDHDKSQLAIADLQFPSATRGIAAGMIVEGRHRRPVALVTSDGGAHWQEVALKDPPLSLFFLNENKGWMVTTKGLWQTVEAGKSWTKLPKVPGQIYRVYFTDEKTGWAVGPKKSAFETQDGGLHWRPLPAAGEQPGMAPYSAYTWVTFASREYGVITGWNIPPRFLQSRPDWVDPAAALRIRETPHLSYVLTTLDGGRTWKSSSASLFGTITRIRVGSKGTGLGLIEYGQSFQYPSEAYFIDWLNGKNRSLYRDPHFAVSDVWLGADGTAYLAGNLVRGQLRGVLPGKVQVLTSKDLATWTPMPVDYRAEATRTVLAGDGGGNLWLATDTGMILKLER